MAEDGRHRNAADGPFAGMDVGTNSVKLTLMARGPAGRWRVLADAVRVPRLGEGLSRTGRLSEEAMARTLAAVREMVRAIGDPRPAVLAAAGTEALRRAANGAEFAERFREATGAALEIIGGGEEARLTALGAQAALGLEDAEAGYIDIGAGSTEIVLSAGGALDDRCSLPVGVLSLVESVLRGDPPPAARVEAAGEAVRAVLAGRSWPARPLVVGIGETMSTLAAVFDEIPDPADPSLHGRVLTCREIERIYKTIEPLPAAKILALPGVWPGREDLLLAGAVILRCVMDALGAERLMVSLQGLRHGLVADRFGAGA